jgi:hypothetical protein
MFVEFLIHCVPLVNIVFAIECGVENKIWGHGPFSYMYVSLWCTFFDPPNYEPIKYRDSFKKCDQITPPWLRNERQSHYVFTRSPKKKMNNEWSCYKYQRGSDMKCYMSKNGWYLMVTQNFRKKPKNDILVEIKGDHDFTSIQGWQVDTLDSSRNPKWVCIRECYTQICMKLGPSLSLLPWWITGWNSW